MEQSEWATDVVFRTPEALAALYPRLVHHAITTFSSRDVLRFLQQKVPAHGGVHGKFAGEVVSDLKQRPEGVRIKHRCGANSLKLYDKQGQVLRVETTINDAAGLKAYRPVASDPEGAKQWQPLRKGVADLYRRCELSQAANGRYLEALGAVESPTPLEQLSAVVPRDGQGGSPLPGADQRQLEFPPRVASSGNVTRGRPPWGAARCRPHFSKPSTRRRSRRTHHRRYASPLHLPLGTNDDRFAIRFVPSRQALTSVRAITRRHSRMRRCKVRSCPSGNWPG